MNNENREVLLKVEHLEQFFKFNRAVNDVNFEIYKGEVFGLVGESGCGKTTTGRSIIKLYDITGGSVYFNGTRIAAGVRTYKEAIKNAKELHKANVKAYKEEYKKGIENGVDSSILKKEMDEKIKKSLDNLLKVQEENQAQIKSARFDHKNCNKVYADSQA
jgi:oligopeptide transport system ATP-binding protein